MLIEGVSAYAVSSPSGETVAANAGLDRENCLGVPAGVPADAAPQSAETTTLPVECRSPSGVMFSLAGEDMAIQPAVFKSPSWVKDVALHAHRC